MVRGAARRQCGYWAVARTVYHFTSTSAIPFQRRAVVLATGHRQSTGATIYHTTMKPYT